VPDLLAVGGPVEVQLERIAEQLALDAVQNVGADGGLGRQVDALGDLVGERNVLFLDRVERAGGGELKGKKVSLRRDGERREQRTVS
jgi:hypothetical protein